MTLPATIDPLDAVAEETILLRSAPSVATRDRGRLAGRKIIGA
jgi:hypothetical protein